MAVFIPANAALAVIVGGATRLIYLFIELEINYADVALQY
jgi:hypothetical protein